MHKHASSPLQTILYKSIALREVLQQVLVLVILYIDREMPERLEQLDIQRLVYHGQDVRDIGCFDFFCLVEGVETGW
jgi:hypothetical protein